MSHCDVFLNIFSGADLVSVGDYSETNFLSETIKILHGKSLNFWVGLKKDDGGNIFTHMLHYHMKLHIMLQRNQLCTLESAYRYINYRKFILKYAQICLKL